MTKDQIIVEAVSRLATTTANRTGRYIRQGAVYSAKIEAIRLAEQLAVLETSYQELW